MDSQGGWIGITSKYWLVASIIPNDAKVSARAFYDPKLDSFQGDFTGAGADRGARRHRSFTNQIFAGAKEIQRAGRLSRQRWASRCSTARSTSACSGSVAKPLFIVLDCDLRR